MVSRIIAIIFIYICCTVAWVILGTTVLVRSETQDGKLRGMVGKLWGTPHRQQAPEAWYETKHDIEQRSVEAGRTNVSIQTEIRTHPVPLEKSRMNTDLALEYRRKGLLWYSTYKVHFVGQYAITNDTSDAREVFVKFRFPAAGAVYDNFHFIVGGQPVKDVVVRDGAVQQSMTIAPRQSQMLEVSYDSQGLDQWWYDFGDEVSQVKDFSMAMTTDSCLPERPRPSMRRN